MRILLAIALLVRLAAAESRTKISHEWIEDPPTSTLRFGAVKGVAIDHVDVDIAPDATSTRVTVAFTLSANVRRPSDLQLPLEVPHGAQVTDLAVHIRNQPRLVARMRSASSARETYESIVRHEEDPALLEFVKRTERSDLYSLRVYPLDRTQPARVELVMTMPRTASFTLHPGANSFGHVAITLGAITRRARGVAAPRSLELPAPPELVNWMDQDPSVGRPAVDSTRSLIATSDAEEPEREYSAIVFPRRR